MLQIIILYALFASTFSLGKLLLSYTHPVFLVGIRMSIAGLVLLTYQYFQNWSSFKINKKDWWLYIQAMLCTTYFPYIFRFLGLKHMDPSKASLIYTLGPFATYLFSYLMGLEKMTPKKSVGLLVGFFGLMPMLITPSPKEGVMGGVMFFSWAELSIIASISILSYGWIVMHKLVKENNYEPAMINGISMFTGGILALLTSWQFEGAVEINDMRSFLVILTIVILVSNLLCHNMYGALLKKYSPTFLSFASFLTPLFTALYGWLFSSKTPSWEFMLSASCVLLGLAIFYQDELQYKKKVETITLVDEL